jgi:hypothetical protein
MLASYSNIRPKDLFNINEGSIDLQYGVIELLYPSKVKNIKKTIRLLDQHIEIIKDFKREYPGLPNIPFFRHSPNNPKAEANQAFGRNIFYKNWVRACVNLGIRTDGIVWICDKCSSEWHTKKNIPGKCRHCGNDKVSKKKQLCLYGGTRHTLTTQTAKLLGEKKAKQLPGNSTNKAAERYCLYQDDETFDMVQIVNDVRGKNNKILELKKGGK